MACTVQACCCCCSLKTGAILIGVLQGVFAAVSIAYMARTMVETSTMGPKPDIVLAQEHGHLTVAAVYVILAVVLVSAAVKEKETPIKVWLAINITLWIITTLLYTALCVFLFLKSSMLYAIVYLTIVTLISVVNAYCLVMVFSFYHQLSGAASQQPAPLYSPVEGRPA